MSKERKTTDVAKRAGASEATSARRGRFSAPRKAQAVLRLLRGEDLELLSRELEAAGIEPASRDISAEASTCVVDLLSLADQRSDQQDRCSASQDFVSLSAVPAATEKYPAS